MRMKTIMMAAVATSMTATPVLAAQANPAASLSVAKATRTTASGEKSNKLAGAGLIGVILAAGIIAIPVIQIVKDNDDSDSN